jgi:hypothetical protein
MELGFEMSRSIVSKNVTPIAVSPVMVHRSNLERATMVPTTLALSLTYGIRCTVLLMADMHNSI